MKNLLLIITILILGKANGQGLIQSGPMLGYSDFREVAIWVQTKNPAKVKFRFWDLENPTKTRETESANSTKINGNAVTAIADSLLPGKKYGYELLVNEKVQKFNYPLRFQTIPLWQFRSDPPEFIFAVGSCTYVNEPFWDRPGKSYGDSMQIFKTIFDP